MPLLLSNQVHDVANEKGSLYLHLQPHVSRTSTIASAENVGCFDSNPGGNGISVDNSNLINSSYCRMYYVLHSSTEEHAVYSMKYTQRYVLLCFVVVICSKWITVILTLVDMRKLTNTKAQWNRKHEPCARFCMILQG